MTAEAPHAAQNISFSSLALGSIVVLCAALRLYHLGAASLWSDEVFSRYYPDLFGVRYVLTKGLSVEATPPTYALLLRAWISVWGDSEAALRSLSVVAGTLCIPAIYLLGRELAGKAQGLLAALLFALCPTGVYFAQEARVYALLMLCTSMTLWSAAFFQRAPHSKKASVLYFTFGVLCIYLHATGLLFVLACGGAVWFSLLIQGSPRRNALFKWTGLNAIVLMCGAPYFVQAVKASRSAGLDWIPPVGIHRIIYCFSTTVMGTVTPYPRPGFFLAAALFVALAVSLYLHHPSLRAGVTLIGVPLFFVALVILTSLARPILISRILSWTVVPLCLVVSIQILKAGRARVMVLLAIIAAFGTGLVYQITTPGSDKEPWQETFRAVEPDLQHADLVVLSPLFNPLVMTHYAPEVKNVRLWDASLPPTIMTEAASRLHIPPISESEILQAIAEKRSVWILSNAFDLGRLNDLRDRVPATVYRERYCGNIACVGAAGWQGRD